MSVKISGQVWELELDPMDKFFLLCVADHADHDGKNIKPGNDLICAKTGLSHQTVSAKIAKFTEAGVLIPATESYGRGKPREFEMELVSIERRDYFIQKDRRKMQARRSFETVERCKHGAALETERCKLTGQKVQADSEKVQADSFSHDKERARVEPSEPSIESSEREPLALAEGSADAENLFATIKLVTGFQPVDFDGERKLWAVAEKLRGGKITSADLTAYALTRTKSSPKLQYLYEDVCQWKNTNGNHSQPSRHAHCQQCGGSGRRPIVVNGKLTAFEVCGGCNGSV